MTRIDYLYNNQQYDQIDKELTASKKKLNIALVAEAGISDTAIDTINGLPPNSSNRINDVTKRQAPSREDIMKVKEYLLERTNGVLMPEFNPKHYNDFSLEFQLAFIETNFLNNKVNLFKS